MTAADRTPAEETAAAAREVVERMTARGLQLATAESTVGGLIGHALTDVHGASRVFPGGITAYANPPKQALLGVPASVLEAHGSVSAETALAMAHGARAAFGSDLALRGDRAWRARCRRSAPTPTGRPASTTSRWSPMSFERVERHVFPGDREETKQRAAAAALRLVLDYLDGAGS